MSYPQLKILPTSLLDAFCTNSTDAKLKAFNLLKESELSIDSFSFYTSVSAVYSSKIEGEDIELDSYVKHKRFGIEFLPNYTQKIDDLYEAYQFAKTAKCTEENINIAHLILTKNILPKHKQGKLRTGNMYVTSPEGKIEYVAVSPFSLKHELEKFYHDLDTLMSSELTIQKVFYFASLLHLVFVKIHPFDDGNGRTGRLIEKWFLAEKLGEKVWLIESEKNYYLNHQTYYDNIRVLGLEYELLDYSKALNFLLMLPPSIRC
ncbi:MAG TPA: Fic family protein [Saprospiraceae bacterium]|nr:Fic family protein [Saprospiraceae bacterium]